MDKQSAEDKLRQHATTLGCSMRDLRQLVLQVFIDDENFQKRINESMQQQIQAKQIKLLDVELNNRGMEETLLQAKLHRKIARIKRWEKIKSVFTFKKKSA